jgi:DNA helicase-2/ATP-dependent DNA helicase PcrA
VDDAEAALAGLDPEQEHAARAVRGPVCILAGAGTGKTRTITHRIAYAVRLGAVPPGQLLAVTFTVRAAGEMRARLRSLGVGGVQARTFHAAALRQLRYFAPRVLGGPMPDLVENKIRLVAQAATRSGIREADRILLRDLASEVEWAKVSMVAPADYPARVAAAGREPPVAAATVAAILAAYEEAKSRAGLLDFEDLLLVTAAALEQHRDVADQVRAQYRHFVVDEYQDVSPLQQRLLDAWLGGRDDVCVVGDPNQTIYSFTGATPSYLLSFPRRHPGTEVVRLLRDYRSTPQVVGLANRVLGRRATVRLVGQRRAGPEPAFAEYPDEPAEAAAAAARCRALLDAGLPASEIAVLFRVNAQSEAYERALTEAAVPYLVRGGERFFARAEVREAIVLLRGAARSASVDDSPPAGGRPDAAEPPGAAPQARRPTGAVPTDAPPEGRGPTGVQPDGTPPEEGRPTGAVPTDAPPGGAAGEGLEAGRTERVDAGGGGDGGSPAGAYSPADAVRDVLAALGWSASAPPAGGAARERWESLAALVGLAEELAGTVPGATLVDLVVELEQRAAAQHAPTVQGVTLASLHAAKGLEWDAVFLVGLVEGTVPIQHASTEAQLDEERRLLYVGITRAREHLTLSWSLSRAPGGRRTRRRSRFLYGLAPEQPAAPRPKPAREASNGRAGQRTKELPAGADPELFDRLRAWRTARAQAQQVPAYVVLNDATLGAIAASRPADVQALVAIPGIGPRKLDLYGADVLAIVHGDEPPTTPDRRP